MNTINYADLESMQEKSRGGTITSTVKSEEFANILKKDMGKVKGSPYRVARMLEMLTKDGQVMVNIPEKDKSMFSQTRYAFMLDAPFEISQKCCLIMKKQPVHKYSKRSKRKGITAQMASESRLRTQQWLKHGCNAFDTGNPISNPMSFWTEQDVLLYIYENKLEIASVYGDVVIDYAKMGQVDNQMSFADFGIFDNERPTLKTTGCSRTGCMFCGFGCHLEKSPNRFERMRETHPKQYEYIMKSSEEGGLNYKEIIDWINEHGNMSIKY